MLPIQARLTCPSPEVPFRDGVKKSGGAGRVRPQGAGLRQCLLGCQSRPSQAAVEICRTLCYSTS